jgi:hypothetical protein
MLISLVVLISGPRFPFLSNCLQQPPHFGFRSNGDTHKPGPDVLASLAEKNPLLLELLKECQPAGPEIRE